MWWDQKAEVPQSEFFQCAVQAKPTFPKLCFFGPSGKHAWHWRSLLPTLTHTEATNSAVWEVIEKSKPLRNLKSFGLVTHLTAAISTSQPNTGTDDEDTKTEQREMSFLLARQRVLDNQLSSQLHKPHNDFASVTVWWLLPPDKVTSKVNILITTNWGQVGSVPTAEWLTHSFEPSMEKGLASGIRDDF